MRGNALRMEELGADVEKLDRAADHPTTNPNTLNFNFFDNSTSIFADFFVKKKIS